MCKSGSPMLGIQQTMKPGLWIASSSMSGRNPVIVAAHGIAYRVGNQYIRHPLGAPHFDTQTFCFRRDCVGGNLIHAHCLFVRGRP